MTARERSTLLAVADRIEAGDDIDAIRAEYPDMLIHVSRIPLCEHDWSGDWVELPDGGSATCAKCGMLAINDRSIWDDFDD